MAVLKLLQKGNCLQLVIPFSFISKNCIESQQVLKSLETQGYIKIKRWAIGGAICQLTATGKSLYID
jgi:hypothetical protein